MTSRKGAAEGPPDARHGVGERLPAGAIRVAIRMTREQSQQLAGADEVGEGVMEQRHWFGVEQPRGFKHEMLFLAFLSKAARARWIHAPKPSPTCHRFIEWAEWVRAALQRDGGGGNVYLGSNDERAEAEHCFDCEQAIEHWEETFGTPMPEGAAPLPVRM